VGTTTSIGDERTGSPIGIDRCLADGASALIAFSHLRWGGVYQRPQHLLARFARDVPVTVVEEPLFLLHEGATPDLRVTVHDDVTVLTPVLPIAPGLHVGFNPETNPAIATLIAPILAELGRVDVRSARAAGSTGAGAGPILWYYTPMALGATPAGLDPALVVFDAMDDLASFHSAPPALRAQEAALFAAADLVFAGGPSLYEARRDRHPSVHCFPSGVEPAHFARAAGGLAPHPALAALPRPVLGFYGVLDERLDLELIAAVADARPDWTLALVGPVVKIAERDLPRRPNIAYVGQQPYADLPAFLAGFDVALLPFARNEATRSISPTKTLEYLAGEKPVVSTSIADVVSLYGDAVRVADDPAAFVAAVDAALAESSMERRRRHAAGRAHLLRHDWDAIAQAMTDLMVGALGALGPRSGT
jgi:UDP-galactopyranose mutase